MQSEKQQEVIFPESLNATEGKWKISNYRDQIVKLTFIPYGYIKGELISNAVIVKPLRRGTPNEHALKKISIEGYFSFEQYRGFKFRLKPGEQIFGGGERALPLNRRGSHFNLYNSPWYGYENGADNLNFSVPLFISTEGYGLFFDNPSKGYVDIGKKQENILEAGFVSGQLNVFVIPGRTIDEIIRRYTNLTGRQPLPPRWAFGNFMSRFGYQSEEQSRTIYELMKKEEFPMDAIIFDLFWFGETIKKTLGNLDWGNKEKWPDPVKMIADFKSEKIKTILITEPFILNTTSNYSPSKAFHTTDSIGRPLIMHDFYFGEGGLIDIFRNDAQDWFWSKYKKQIETGIAGWWGDLGEPEKHPVSTFHNLKDLGLRRRFSADEVHNLYGHYWSKMLFEKYADEYPDVRLFHLNRAGFAGSQRYSVFPWTGDVHRNWNGFRAQLPVLLGMSLCGIPYTHSDAGGFAMGERDPDLYTRWLQFAAFTPIFRPHGTALGAIDPSTAHIESEPVFFDEPHKSILRKTIQQRYDLSPYNYSLAYQQYKFGKPLMRPMFYMFPADPECYKTEDQFFWGDHILVAPVLYKNATSRKIYLPAGNWFDFNKETFYKGGEWIVKETEIASIPLFIREGTFIPMVKNLMNLDQYSSSNLEVLYVPSRNLTSYVLFDDDGVTNMTVEKKMFELISFKGLHVKDKLMLSISCNGGNFRGKPEKRKINLKIPGVMQVPLSLSVNRKLQAAGNILNYNPETKTLYFPIEFTGETINIVINLTRQI